MADIVDIALSAEASGVADSILEKGLFKNKSDVMTFAAAYMIKYYFDEFDPINYVVTDSGGNNYNIGTVDNDGMLSVLLKTIYPNSSTPYTYARSLMVFGLMKIGERMKQEGIPSVSSLCD